MKKKSYLMLALLVALAFSGGTFAYTYTTALVSMGLPAAEGDIATSEPAPAGDQPDWNSIIQAEPGTEISRPSAAGDETRIETQEPDSGEHWDKVDEDTSDGDNTYVATSTADWQEDLYHMADHSVGSGTIAYVRVYMVLRAVSTPSQSSAYAHIKTGGVEHNGSEDTMTTSYATYSYQWDTNPQTGGVWTWDEIDALQIGVGLRRAIAVGSATAKQTRGTQVYAEVGYGAISLCGDVPTGDLFVATPHPDYAGDLTVKVYLVNTAALIEAYQYLNMELTLQGAAENPQLLTLHNGVATFALQGCAGGTHSLSVTGGSYCLVSDDPEEWEAGWTLTPELYCEATQR